MMRKLLLLLLLVTVTGIATMAQETWQRGEHSFVYTGYEPLADKPITVYYYIPIKGDIKTMRVLFSMHGADRKGAPNIETWRYFAEEEGVVVIAPEYTPENGWKSNDYQLGGLYTNSKHTELNPPEKWTYNTVEALFDYFKEGTGNQAEKYDIHGHSAGGQFVHRLVLTMPNARIRLAVASNPSAWTYPLIDGLKDKKGNVYGWPYSVMGTPFATEEHVKRYLAAPLIVHLGNADVQTDSSDLDKSDGANAQGPCRYDRGNAFFKASKQLAKEMKTPFNWKKVEVEDVGHAGRTIVYGKKRTENGKNVFSTDYITTTGAYYLIYKK